MERLSPELYFSGSLFLSLDFIHLQYPVAEKLLKSFIYLRVPITQHSIISKSPAFKYIQPNTEASKSKNTHSADNYINIVSEK